MQWHKTLEVGADDSSWVGVDEDFEDITAGTIRTGIMQWQFPRHISNFCSSMFAQTIKNGTGKRCPRLPHISHCKMQRIPSLRIRHPHRTRIPRDQRLQDILTDTVMTGIVQWQPSKFIIPFQYVGAGANDFGEDVKGGILLTGQVEGRRTILGAVGSSFMGLEFRMACEPYANEFPELLIVVMITMVVVVAGIYIISIGTVATDGVVTVAVNGVVAVVVTVVVTIIATATAIARAIIIAALLIYPVQEFVEV
mmetsp:Transcript_17488/g.26459  ORF Transcript_17488/g.26459 Transcript_17488/m.26459 type:complete len:253 (-) Transcript_17488:163-921(-)